jgi:hypothetical protein
MGKGENEMNIKIIDYPTRFLNNKKPIKLNRDLEELLYKEMQLISQKYNITIVTAKECEFSKEANNDKDTL